MSQFSELINIWGCWTSLYFCYCCHYLLTFQLFSRYQSQLSWPQFLSLLVWEGCSKAWYLGAWPLADGCNVTRAPSGWTDTQLPENLEHPDFDIVQFIALNRVELHLQWRFFIMMVLEGKEGLWHTLLLGQFSVFGCCYAVKPCQLWIWSIHRYWKLGILFFLDVTLCRQRSISQHS